VIAFYYEQVDACNYFKSLMTKTGYHNLCLAPLHQFVTLKSDVKSDCGPCSLLLISATV